MWPLSKSTAIAWPGPNLPLKIIFSFEKGIIPVSDPANKSLSDVIVYLSGRKPFLSCAAIIHFQSVAEIAAGPSQGSIVLFKKLNNCW